MSTFSAIFGASLAFAFSIWLGRISYSALRSGTAEIAGGKKYRRTKNMFMYWLTVIIQLLFFVMALWVGIVRLTRM